MFAPHFGRSAPRLALRVALQPLGLLALLKLCLAAWADCPCREPELCRQIRPHPDFEVFVFDVGQKTWKSYDWSQITTVAAFGKYDSELMCYAHSKGARVVLKGDVPLKNIIDPNFRASWIAQKLHLAKTQYMDGINIDIEQEVICSSPEYDALTALVKETTESFHHEIEGSQITFDVAWSIEHTQKVELLRKAHKAEPSLIPGKIMERIEKVLKRVLLR